MNVEAHSPLGIKAIYLKARSIDDGNLRQAYLDEACRDDSQLRSQVEKLLGAGQLDRSPVELAAENLGLPCDGDLADLDVTGPGKSHTDTSVAGFSHDFCFDVSKHPQIGPYKLLEQIGQGGMGSVYMAQQTAPIKRKVALKVIKPGMDSKDVVDRFEAERQALAMMDHSNIARVFDGGATEAGQPYFVMELVRGLPINEYCDKRKLTTSERLELFIVICHAVQHAHRKGIIHRDLKPTNILVAHVDGRAVPKVIDFGVAKALHQRLTDHTVYTQFSQMIGTPLYMSPEQAEMGLIDIDTRSDVYSLGVILYELLTGETPCPRQRLKSLTFDEMRRIIREEEPQRPSAMVSTLKAEAQSTIAECRGIDIYKVNDCITGELDWLVMKALEKDRSRRYESANEFAADISRYLNDEPVKACPPSYVYAFQKFARRHRVAITAAGVCLILLFAGIATTTWQMLRAIEAEARAEKQADRANEQAASAQLEAQRAEAEAATAKAINRFVTEDLLSQADHTHVGAPDPDVRLRDVVDRARKSVESRFNEHPLVKASIQLTLSSIYESLGESEPALELAQQSLAIRQSKLGANSPDTLSSKYAVAWMLFRVGKLEEAETQMQQVYESRCAVLGEQSSDTLITLGSLGDILDSRGQFEEAVEIERRVLKGQRRLVEDDADKDIAVTLVRLAMALHNQAEYEEAIASYREALAIYERIDSPSGHAMVLGNLANVYLRQGEFTQSEELLRQSLKLKTEYLGGEHYWTVADRSNLGVLFSMQGKHAESEVFFRQVLELYRKTRGDAAPETLQAMQNLGMSLRRLERFSEASELARETVELYRDVHGEEHPRSIQAMDILTKSLRAEGQTEEALNVQLEQLELCRSAFGSEHQTTIQRMETLASNLGACGRYTEAESFFREALDLRRAIAGQDDPLTLVAAKNLEILYLIWSRELTDDPQQTQAASTKAVELARKAIELRTTTEGASETIAEVWRAKGFGEVMFSSPAAPLTILGVALYCDGQWRAAVETLEKAEAAAPTSGDQGYKFVAAMAHSKLGNRDVAIRCFDEARIWMIEAEADEGTKRLYQEAIETLEIGKNQL